MTLFDLRRRTIRSKCGSCPCDYLGIDAPGSDPTPEIERKDVSDVAINKELLIIIFTFKSGLSQSLVGLLQIILESQNYLRNMILKRLLAANR
jgi:hypothetical protein